MRLVRGQLGVGGVSRPVVGCQRLGWEVLGPDLRLLERVPVEIPQLAGQLPEYRVGWQGLVRRTEAGRQPRVRTVAARDGMRGIVAAETRVIGDVAPRPLYVARHAGDDAVHGGVLLPGEVVSEEVLDHCLARLAPARVGWGAVHARPNTLPRVHRPGGAIDIPVPRGDRQEAQEVLGPVVYLWVWTHEDAVHHLVHDVPLRAEVYRAQLRVVVVF